MEEKKAKNVSMLQKGFGLAENQTRDVRKHRQGSNEVIFAFTE